MSLAHTIIDGCLVWDNHVRMPLRPLDTRFLPQPARYRAAGFDHVSIKDGFGDDSIEHRARMIGSFRHWLAERADEYLLV